MYNKAIIIGNLGEDPNTKVFEKGQVSNFSVATSRSYKDKNGERQDVTQWHRVVLWNKLSEIADKYLTKGSKVMIEGEIIYSSFEDKEGNKRYKTEIVGSELKMLSSKKESAQSSAEPTQGAVAEKVNTGGEEEEDDLPF